MASIPPRLVRFGRFTFDPDAGDLRRNGTNVDLPPQPTRLLTLLVERAGRTVSRAEIRARLWDEEAVVEFDQGINASVRNVRDVLGDDAASPTYVETVPRRGYRFVAPIERRAAPARTARSATTLVPRPVLVIALAVGLLLAADRDARPPAATGATRSTAVPDHADARAAYVRARVIGSDPAPHAQVEAVDLLERAVLLEPGFAPARVALADAYDRIGTSEAIDRARVQVEIALELDPALVDGHVRRAELLLFRDRDPISARVALDAALRFGPDRAAPHRLAATYHALEGRHDRALEHLERALALAPRSTSLEGEAGMTHYLAGRYDRAAEHCRRALALDPDHVPSLRCLVDAGHRSGRPEEARRAAERILAIHGAPDELRDRLREMPPDEAVELFRRLTLAWLRERGIAPYARAVLQAELGRPERALSALEEAIEARDRFAVFAARDPAFDRLRDDPRLAALLAPRTPAGTRSE